MGGWKKSQIVLIGGMIIQCSRVDKSKATFAVETPIDYLES